jgi:DNA primase
MTWLQPWTTIFTGKKVWICYDRDAIGQRGAAKVARSIQPVATEVRFIDLPLSGTPDRKDISDFFKYGGTCDGFRKLIDNARPFIPRVRRTGK